MDLELKVLGGVVACIVILSIVSTMSQPVSIRADLKVLVQQAAQLCEMSRQDSDPMIALQHASEAVAYLHVARRLASDSSISQATQIDPQELEKVLLQRRAEAISTKFSGSANLTSIVAGYSTL